MNAPAILWTVERTASRRFPFRVAIEQGGRLVAAFRTQAAWPGPGQQIFCLREEAADPDESLQPVERVPVLGVTRVGRKLTLVLDRPNRKRCEFLTIRKPRRDGGGEYEQTFFRTESGIRAHRSRSRVELRASAGPLTMIVDSGERYPWRFPDATVTRRKLAVGDYALLDGSRIAAVVERKSFENLLTDVGAIQALHQQLADLAAHQPAAFVIEADYRDFLDPARLKGHWPPAHLARVLAELSALHPTLPMIYAGNRKLANVWTERFFAAVQVSRAAPEPELELDLDLPLNDGGRPVATDVRIREAALSDPAPFRFAELAAKFPDVPATRVRRVLVQLKNEGAVVREGGGSAARWRRAQVTG